MDTALSLLQQALPDGGQCILCLDENTLGNALNLPEQCRVYSNRWDIAKTIKAAQFSDWQLAEQGVDCFAFRVSKEKAVNHYLINRAFTLLAPGGSLIFAGEKNQGTKTYAKKAGQLLGQAEIEKHGMDYLVKVTKTCANTDKLLDDQDYQTLRSIAALEGLELYSKPGQFGWNKLDKGSLFLLELITEKLNSSVSSLLDLGCGYGLLACQLGLQLNLETIVATDNNAAALASCEHNLQQLNALHPKLNTQVIAADCADRIEQRFDLIVCNPPFHQGFNVDNSLTDKFLNAAKNHLNQNGQAYFVVNSFIGIEKKAQQIFKRVETLANNKQFKVLRFS